MSGMNAISGITVLGAIVTASVAVGTGSRVLAGAAIILATVNMVGGFGVTHRMLRMFKGTAKKAGDA
jgi:NAD(P) transhydrogenase subunit alpha